MQFKMDEINFRYPFCDELRRAKYRHMITSQPEKLRQKSEEFIDHPAGRVLGEKAFRIAEFSMVFTDLSKYQKILHQVESILDEVKPINAIQCCMIITAI